MSEEQPERPDALRSRQDVDERYVVPGLSRGLAVLRLFGRGRAEMTLAEIAEAIGLSRSAAYRLVYTLEKEGFLVRNAPSKAFRLTSKVMTLGYSFLSTVPLVEIVHPYLRRISDRTGAASHLVGLDGPYAVYLARVTPAARLVSNLQVGMRLPAHTTVSGRVLLAGQSDAALEALHPALIAATDEGMPRPALAALLERARADRANGYVADNSIFEPRILSLAVPVLDAAGGTAGALNVLGPDELLGARFDTETLRAIVSEEAGNLASAAGHVRP